MDMTRTAGFVGAIIAGIAYLPQITHLIFENCTAGISRLAYSLWLVAAVLLLYHAVALMDPVFILLSGIQVASTAIVLLFCLRYGNAVCGFHARKK